MAYTWQKTRRGASLIIAMFLCVLILLYAMPLANLNVAIIKNIERAQNAGALSDARNSAEQIAGDLVYTTINPYADPNIPNPPVEDYSLYIDGHYDKFINTDIWFSTGCPVPNKRPDGFSDAFGDSASVGELFKQYDKEGNESTVTLLEHCYGANYTSAAPHYYVYPSPVVNNPNRAPITVASNCEPRKLYNTYKNEPIDPLSHPCYWGDLEPGETVRIPLNKYGWSLSEITNLKLRLRTKCVDGSDWCKDRGRVTYASSIIPCPDGSSWCEDPTGITKYVQPPNTPNSVDATPTIATWVIEVEKGIGNFGSSRGDAEFLSTRCATISGNCRDIEKHSEITAKRMASGLYRFDNITSYFDFNLLVSTVSARVLEVVDLSTNLSVKGQDDYILENAQNLLNYFYKIWENHPPEIIFQLDNVTRSDNNGQTLEYQIISNRKIPKK